MVDFDKYMIAEESILPTIRGKVEDAKRFVRKVLRPKVDREIKEKAKEYENLPAKDLVTKTLQVIRPLLNTDPSLIKNVKYEVSSSDWISNPIYAVISGAPVAYTVTKDKKLETMFTITNIDVHVEGDDERSRFMFLEVDGEYAATIVADPISAKSYVKGIIKDGKDMRRFNKKNPQ